MKIMYVLFEGFDTDNGTNHLALKTMEEYLKDGFEVHLVTSHSKGLHRDIPEQLKKNHRFSYTVIKRKNVSKRNFLGRYIDGIRYSLKCIPLFMKMRRETDVILIQSTYTVFYTVFLANMIMKKPIIYNTFDVFPDGDRDVGAISNKFIIELLNLMQKYVYRVSNKIVVISEDMLNTFLNKGIPGRKLVLIRNWYDSSCVKKIENTVNRFMEKYSINRDKFIIQYAGNFGYTFDYKAIIEIAIRLRKEHDIEFHMIGSGAFEKDFKRAVKMKGLDNIKFFPWQDLNMIADVYSACDLEIVTLSKNVIKYSYPSKLSLVMSCGKTFMCMTEKQSYFFKYVNDKEIGKCINFHEYQKAADWLVYISKNKNRLEQLERNAYHIGGPLYSSDNNAYKYVDIAKELGRKK